MNDVLQQAKEYEVNCEKIRRAHYIAWESNSRMNLYLGIPVVFLTAAAGTSIFSSIQNNSLTWLLVLSGIVSFLATVLSALQTYLKPAEKAGAHKAAAARYAAMRRKLEHFALNYSQPGNNTSDDQVLEALQRITHELDIYAENCPALADRFMSRAEQEQT